MLDPDRIRTEYVEPLCTPDMLDRWAHRRAIANTLKDRLSLFHGVLLDIGCGYMPYKSLLLASSQVSTYVGMDIVSETYRTHDVRWDGRSMPFGEHTVDCAIATELLEHCLEPDALLREAYRVLKPNGFLLLTVPFLWPLHDTPYDYCRYTPFMLEHLLRKAGFPQTEIWSLGGWHACLAQSIGLWVRRSPISERKRWVLSRLAVPLVRYLVAHDYQSASYVVNDMYTGLAALATKR